MLFPCHNIRTLCFAFWLSLFVLCGGRLWAQGTAPLSPPEDLSTLTGNDLVTVTLHSDIARFQPGQQLTLAVQYDIRPGWHLYWRNPGDNGMPPSLSIKAGPGVVVGTPLYPRPKVFQKKQGDSTETSFGYEGSVCLLVPLSITRSFEGTRLDLALELEWLGSDRLTNGNDEGHAEELAAERPLDLVEKVLVGGAEVPQDQPELGQRPVERVVVDLHHFVPLLKQKKVALQPKMTDNNLQNGCADWTVRW